MITAMFLFISLLIYISLQKFNTTINREIYYEANGNILLNSSRCYYVIISFYFGLFSD